MARKRLVAPKRTRRSTTKSRKASPARAKQAPRRSTRRRRGGPRRRRGLLGWIAAPFVWVFRLFMALMLRGGIIVALMIGAAVIYIYSTLPEYQALLDGRSRGSVTLLDRNGEIFAWRGEQFGGQISTGTVSPYLRDAIIATEDKRFRYHPGVDPIGIATAIRINLSEGRGPLSGHGGSTLTQQTAKLICLGVPYDPDKWEDETAYEADCRESSLWRKAKEAVYALALEAKYTKDEILTIYMNRVFLGAGSRGFEAAAQRYFGKSANEVDAAEAAMLAGLLVAPTRYAPTANLERSQNRAAVIVRLMEEQGYLTTAEAQRARQNPARLSAAAEARAGGYFADWVMSQAPDFLTTKTTEDVILRTTFDQRIQRAAERALQHVFDTKVKAGSKAQAAIVVMSADGAVRAMVGGRRFKGVAGQFNRAIMAKRQTGSAFKPFVYATALELGYSPLDTVVDEPTTINVPGSGPWKPENYTRNYRGRVTMLEALEDSLNIPAVKVSEAVGRNNVRRVATDFGIDNELANGPSLALGVSESTLLEMSGAYAGILNGGTSVTPYGILDLRMKGESSPIIGQTGGLGERVISTSAARQLVYMMSKVIDEGTGTRAQLGGRPAAGKTGTTQAARDAWFLGFTADYVAGVWMGYDDNTPLKGVTGGGLPAEIWRETMLRVHDGMPVHALPMEGPTTPAAPEPAPQPQNNDRIVRSPNDKLIGRVPNTPANVAERIINDVMGRIFGN
ncbi:transglycosylase domain-containing protein [Palleronia caenipelagi]|uniref:peptidoglycan glycosyltransferase n=1 Tax=Palleronia caenipelagi TaxID=2489174 RepID=A0A547Q2S6_9RHOB|nr:PBP1A family penicillin-binding protein [Palleronia caenipelagi]TRD20684.1 PBP1A family penicillin-binding protein [Palleronia caenipelagi]